MQSAFLGKNMKISSVKTIRGIALMLSLLLIMSLFITCYGANNDSFERSISEFPESYRVLLREIHKKYPNWTFHAMDTGLDWDTVIKNETRSGVSLVEEYCSSYAFKSHKAGDFNASTGKYIFKDGSFVSADETAVAWFMDPRNSLTPDTIFQFENLSFSSACTVDLVENILYGSFMYDTKITYYDKNGKKRSENITYADAIYNAGKKYNINPGFLASKIINEIGYSGSSSVSGKYNGYEGIYNFYNIGATDGYGAIGRGLKWASTGKTYSRPWNKPSASITGGAEYLVEEYIAQGQNTGYLQKFQVNPNAGYRLYTHQYMTNVAGAYSQGYSTYLSYVSSGAISKVHNFIIPVYKNMPGAQKPSQVLNIADTYLQNGKLSGAAPLRSGPSNSYTKVYAAVPAGTNVVIKSKVSTDSTNCLNILGYPYWYEVTLSINNKQYTGYIYAGYITEKSKTVLGVGEYTLNTFGSVSGNDDRLTYISSNTSVATVSGDKIKLLKPGKATITAYSPCGGFDTMIVECSTAGDERKVNSLTFSSCTATTATVKWKKAKTADAYQITVLDENSTMVKTYTTKATSCKITGLEKGAKYKVFVRSYTTSASVRTYGGYSDCAVATVPDTVTGCRLNLSEGMILDWADVENADGYELSKLEDGNYIPVKIIKESNAKISESELENISLYRVRAFVNSDKTIYGSYSGRFTVDYTPAQVTKIMQTDTTATGYTIKWSEVSAATGYLVYELGENGKYTVVADTKKCSYTVNNQTYAQSKTFKIKSYGVNRENNRVYADLSRAFIAVVTPKKTASLTYKTVSSGVRLQWNKVSKCDGYIVAQVEDDGGYTTLYKVTDTSCTIPKFKGKMNVAVCAFCESSTGDICSEYTKKCTIGSVAEKISSVKTEKLDNGLRIKWKASKDANGYCVEMYDEDMGVYVPLIQSNKTSITVFGVESGVFRIRSYMKLTGKTLYSGYVKVTV